MDMPNKGAFVCLRTHFVVVAVVCLCMWLGLLSSNFVSFRPNVTYTVDVTRMSHWRRALDIPSAH